MPITVRIIIVHKLPVLSASDNFSFVVNSDKIHEAGYDAYISGYGEFLIGRSKVTIFANKCYQMK